jgi:hypothetical protein
MLLAFAFSSVFLISYIVNHALQGDTIFRGQLVPTKKFILIEIVAFSESRPVAFPDHADRTVFSARLFPSSRCSASRELGRWVVA